MENQEVELPKLPIVKRDANVTVTLDYGEISAIVQAIFGIAKAFTPEQTQQFKNHLENKEKIEDLNMLIYLHLDKLYKKILEEAKRSEQVDFVNLSESLNPLIK